ncbi:MAG: hypothetical protein ABSC88_00475 [Terracidiphilus sp.]|jgi:hypothetical protein
MYVRNVHERKFPLPLATVGALIDSLASRDDRLWPRGKWPPMRFDRPLVVGAVGGHGPIRYSVEEYRPGQSILFRFLAPRGFNGTHCFEVEDRQGKTVLRHIIEMRATGLARLSWPLAIRSLHNAAIEDCFDRATVSLGIDLPHPARWSIYVRLLRAARQMLTR